MGGSLRGYVPGETLDASRAKAEVYIRSWAVADYDAITLTAQDWSLGSAWLLDRLDSDEVPLLAGNVRCGETSLPGVKVLSDDAWRVALVGVAVGTVPDCSVMRPEAYLKETLATLPDVDLTILLFPGERSALLPLSEVLETVDLVVLADSKRQPGLVERVEGLWTISPGMKGYHVGVVDLKRWAGRDGWHSDSGFGALQREYDRLASRVSLAASRVTEGEQEGASLLQLREQLSAMNGDLHRLSADKSSRNLMVGRGVELGPEIGEEPKTEALVRTWKEEGSALPERPMLAPSGSPYGGGDSCAPCHQEIADHWRSTGHGRAWQTLVDEGHQSDAACVGCHVTGWQMPGGPSAVAGVAGFQNVQCEACHGPSREHVIVPTVRPAVPVPGRSHCENCHDGVRDGGQFSYEAYRDQVAHP